MFPIFESTFITPSLDLSQDARRQKMIFYRRAIQKRYGVSTFMTSVTGSVMDVIDPAGGWV